MLAKHKIIICLTAAIFVTGIYFVWPKHPGGNEAELVKAFINNLQKETGDYFTDNPADITTPAITALAAKNPQILSDFAQDRIHAIIELKDSINNTIARNKLGLAKTTADKIKIKQVQYLEQLLSNTYDQAKLDSSANEQILPLISTLKDKGNFRTYYNQATKSGAEITPSITNQDNKLTTKATPYDLTLPQTATEPLILGQNNNQLSLQPDNTTENISKVYDNKALYANIQNGVDKILIAQTTGLNQSFIIKDYTGLAKQDETGVLTLNYNLDLNNLTATEDNGTIILSDQNGNKQYVLTPPVLTDTNKMTPGEAKYVLTPIKKVTQASQPRHKEKLTLTDKLKKIFSFLPIESVIASNQTEIATSSSYQLQIEIKINQSATFPLLVSNDILPVFTRYLDNSQAQETDNYPSGLFADNLSPAAKNLFATVSGTQLAKINPYTSSDVFISKMELNNETEDEKTKELAKNKENPEPTGPFDPLAPREDSQNNELGVKTEFDTLDDQIRQNITFKNGNNEKSLQVSLINSAGYSQSVYQGKTGDTKIYQNEYDIIAYNQNASKNEQQIELKENIYARKPNQANGHSRYVWSLSSPDNDSITLEAQPDGSVAVFAEMQIGGVDPNDKEKQQHVMDVVRQALSNASISGKTQIAIIQPLVYVTADGTQKTANYLIEDNKLIIDIQENLSAYPLLIDPTFLWLQWLGGNSFTSYDYVYALAVNGEEIYAGGYTFSSVSFSAAVYTSGTHSGNYEGFVIELLDNDGAAPTLNWLQWLGGTGSDYLYALAVNGEEIYAGGYTNSATSWETASSTGGTYSGSDEGFVVELADNDGAAPTLNWLQWLGGSSWETLRCLAVNEDEIYAGGYTDSPGGWEAASSTGGTTSGMREGFVFELQDNANAAPTLNWLQWLGGTNEDYVYALAANGEEIYVGGFSSAATSWEAASSTGGTHSGNEEGFVVELQDNAGAAPTLNWRQWLGAPGTDYVYALAVTGDEIYAGGFSSATTSWEAASSTGGAYSAGSEGFVVELQDNAGAAPTLNWLQWFGGTGGDNVNVLAVTGDEIYAGGSVSNATSWEAASSTGGTHSGGTEGFMVELADNEGAAPTLNWLQWLGGTGNDYVRALAMNGEEIYAGGDTAAATSWEAASSTGGTYIGDADSFVIELADNEGAAPTLNWLQLLGGSASVADYVNAVVVNDNEIYIGGYSAATASFSSASFTLGTLSGNNEGFVIELLDNEGAAPTLNWLAWLGGTGHDYVRTLAVNGDEIYAGGEAAAATSWEAASSTGGTHSGNAEGFVVELADNAGAAPTLNWLQWLGGTGNDYVRALAVNADEIYAGGEAAAATSWEAASSTGGTYSAASEGFVVELQDNAGAAPTLNWLQWLGGTSNEFIYALAVNGDEIYAGGNSGTATSWEAASSTNGAHSGSYEGFVVELADNEGAAPTLNWLQWLGGTGDDYVYALAVNADEIYAGGSATNATSWEAASSTGGVHSGSNEGFVVEFLDNAGAASTLNWLQWLGGTGNDYVYALAVNEDEIYAGGYSNSPYDWESVGSTLGMYIGGVNSDEGTTVELADNEGAAPTLNWLAWLGGNNLDRIQALAVNGEEIYFGGNATYATGWESPIKTYGSYSSSLDAIVIKLIDDFTVSIIVPDHNIIITYNNLSYNFSIAVTRATTTFTRTGGAADANSPHVCVLQGTALGVGAHSNLEMKADANICTTDFTALSPDAIYTITLEAETALGALATDTETNVTYYNPQAKTILKRKVKLKRNVIIKN